MLTHTKAYMLYLFPELFSAPVLSITPAEVFERQQFTVTCASSEVASERIERRDVKYTIYRKKQVLSSDGGAYVTTATAETNGEYTCSARVNDTIKQSRSVIFRSKGTTESFWKFNAKQRFASS